MLLVIRVPDQLGPSIPELLLLLLLLLLLKLLLLWLFIVVATGSPFR